MGKASGAAKILYAIVIVVTTILAGKNKNKN